MGALRRHVWWVLVALTVLVVLFGVGDILLGVAFDPGIALGLTGLTPSEVATQSAAGHRLFDFTTRTQGLLLVAVGVLLAVILRTPYRQGQRWAWYAIWVLPIWWIGGVLGLYVAFGVAPGHAPPPPMFSGPILGVLAAAALLFDRSRFFDAGETATAQPAREVT